MSLPATAPRYDLRTPAARAARRRTRHVEGRIFISYRREDAAYPAGWLFDRLAERFGEEQIFKDVDSIELGDDFAEVIGAAVGETDVLLAVIGDKWLTVADERGGRRLDDSEDFVRIEIEAALTRKVRIIPILVEGASMPQRGPAAAQPGAPRPPSGPGAQPGTVLFGHGPAPSHVGASAGRGSRDRGHRDQCDDRTGCSGRPKRLRPASVSARVARRARPLAVTLSLAGGRPGRIIANTQYGPEEGRIDSLRAREPSAAPAPGRRGRRISSRLGRIREQLAYGLLLGFGLTTTAAAIGLGFASAELGRRSTLCALRAPRGRRRPHADRRIAWLLDGRSLSRGVGYALPLGAGEPPCRPGSVGRRRCAVRPLRQGEEREHHGCPRPWRKRQPQWHRPRADRRHRRWRASRPTLSGREAT